MYSQTLQDHAVNPRNRYPLADANAVGESRFPRCGDKMKVFLRISDGILEEVTFTASACAPAIAAASLACTLLQGRTVLEAGKFGAMELHRALGGLPASKRHAILLVLECLHEALEHHTNHITKGNSENVL